MRNSIFAEELSGLRLTSNFRALPKPDIDTANYINLASNDYLGLASRWQQFMPEFTDRFSQFGFSSSASRLLSSRQEIFYSLESLLENLYGKPALLFNSGYHANVGLTGTLAGIKDTCFVCDKLVHASVIDGLRNSAATFRRFHHNDIVSLRKILSAEYENFRNIIVVAESIYSMEGDIAPLKEIVALKQEFPGIMIYLDEAHAFGVRGDRGLGLAEELRLIGEIDFLIGTLGKAAASSGAFVICSVEAKDFFINKARSFIFSTALPPVNVAWSLLMIEKITEMKEERKRLKVISETFKNNTEEISGKQNPSQSQIIPFITGDTETAVRIAGFLRNEAGIFALPIRRPTVPPGRECIRFSLSSSLSDEDIIFVSQKLKEATCLTK